MNDRDRKAEEARRSLAALSRESGLLGGMNMRADDAPEADAVEVWARRAGRALGLVFLVVLALNLFTGWFF